MSTLVIKLYTNVFVTKFSLCVSNRSVVFIISRPSSFVLFLSISRHHGDWKSSLQLCVIQTFYIFRLRKITNKSEIHICWRLNPFHIISYTWFSYCYYQRKYPSWIFRKQNNCYFICVFFHVMKYLIDA